MRREPNDREDARRQVIARVVWGGLVVGYALALLLATGWKEVRDLERAGGGAELGWDKFLHAAAFFACGLLLTKFFTTLFHARLSPRSFVGASALGSTYGVFHEGIQLWLPGLTFNPLDLLADLLGLFLGVWLLRRFLSRATRPACRSHVV